MVGCGCSWNAFPGRSRGKACPTDFNSLSSRHLLYPKATDPAAMLPSQLSCHRDHLSLVMNFTGDESTSHSPFSPSVRVLTREQHKTPVPQLRITSKWLGGSQRCSRQCSGFLYLLGQGNSRVCEGSLTSRNKGGRLSSARRPNLKTWKECEAS